MDYNSRNSLELITSVGTRNYLKLYTILFYEYKSGLPQSQGSQGNQGKVREMKSGQGKSGK